MSGGACVESLRRRIAVVTGTRAEFGLLETVIRAVRSHPALELNLFVAGAHFLPPAETWNEVAERFTITERIPMQRHGGATRLDDADALARGVAGFTNAIRTHQPDWIVVLGDRIEAFAAAAAASVAGVPVAHLHGGDRAEGIADEAMRHAITKLAHLHLPATEQSAERIRRMGEAVARVHVVGSPAMDDLAGIEPLTDEEWIAHGEPEIVLLHHPIGGPIEAEESDMRAIIDGLRAWRTLALHPNHDPGRDGVLRAIEGAHGSRLLTAVKSHLPRRVFVGLLKRLSLTGGVLIGNSSAGLIEGAALSVRVVNIGSRQAGRERSGNVADVDAPSPDAVRTGVERAMNLDLTALVHPFGDGRTGERVAALLAEINPGEPGFTRKRNTY